MSIILTFIFLYYLLILYIIEIRVIKSLDPLFHGV
nr:MAG TPA: hypothetical protein [Caudoviricetes sp.]